ncbi:hypothetical protein BO85DRAFT_488808 [Aspergillus piperis CBS 112811]|uniref:Uncharacterized protein n=1 Tax=Aspergillus piperis CBS 112811 TaxID=1448313 RepID=A0A8G1QZR6_9EURO|nr:hypothetical protein BO85DRAFT_488808 [Aspergillus piperis CBS 112811]RAH56628.1 hypothetical protein BO85DRAFT_488808 [Aspergillus piperis CBS 112811]
MSSEPKQEQQDAFKLDTTPSTDNPESQTTADIKRSEPASDLQATTTESHENASFVSMDIPASLTVTRHGDDEEEAL